jgi:sugar lactone lactonase YvrE
MTEARVLVEAGLELGEGARWLGDRYVLVDILGGRLFELVPGAATLRALADTGDLPLGAVAPLGGAPGRWVAAVGTGIAVLDENGDLDWLGRPEQDAAVPTRMNDGVTDPAGRFWAGSMAWDATPGAGSLYRVGPDRTVHCVLTGLTVPNGPAFSPAGDVMYLADSARGTVFRYGVDPATGDLDRAEPFLTLDAGSPDGMTVDAEGHLWVAVWGEARVLRVAPDGRLDRTVRTPSLQPTSVALGDGELLITSARHGLTDPSPADGAVLSVEVGVGAPATRPAVL